MANRKITTAYSSYAHVDVAPGVDGFFTEAVTPRRLKDNLFFSIREAESEESGVEESSSSITDITVVLQFQCKGDDIWQNYNYNDGAELVPGDRFKIDDSAAAVRWRAGVLYGGYTSGAVRFGFDW